jgi:hypothetical protein
MTQSILFKSIVILAGVAVVGGALMWEVAPRHEAHGESGAVPTPATRGASSTSPEANHDPTTDFPMHLTHDAVATYTDPVYGFAFAYPAAFDLSTSTADGKELVYAEHPSLPLAIAVTISPMAESAAQVQELEAVSDDYNLARLDGIDSNVKARIDESPVPEVPHRGQLWFARNNFLYQVVMDAPDIDTLAWWMRAFLYDDPAFSRP